MATKARAKRRMTQSEVINYFAESTRLKRSEVKEIFDELAKLASRELRSHGEFTVPGFVKVVLARRKARKGRNPATGETIQIPAKTTVKFRLGKSVKESALGDPTTPPDY